MRSNYLSAGFLLNIAYNDNVAASSSSAAIGDVSYSISPTITFNQTTSRQQLNLNYSPGFTFYQHTSGLNAANQSAALNYQYRLSQHTTVSLNDSFQKSSNAFDQLYPVSGGGISGSTLTPPAGVVAPYGDRLSNTASMGISYQFSMNDMIGGSGVFTENNYSNSGEAAGLNDSNSRGGSGFYSRRVSSAQYVGLIYQYSGSQTDPVDANTIPLIPATYVQTHTFSAFYTIYFSPNLSLSLSGGPEYIHDTQSASLPYHAWTPSVTASIASHTTRTNFVLSYSRTVSGVVGLTGAFDSNSASASMQLQIARVWIIGSAANYAILNNVAPSLSSSDPGGHTVTGTVSLQHPMSEHLKAELGYSHLHQSYSNVAAINNAPDSNREFISISYQFTRPLGR
ncbi:MAG: hypothetical protein ABSA39_14070 [Edaphobacter sp.]